MKKDELIALKNRLMSTKKYGEFMFSTAFCPNEIVGTPLLTKEDVISEDSTKESIEFIENSLETAIQYLCCRGIEFDGLEISSGTRTFVSESFLRKRSDCKDEEEAKRINLKPEDILDDYMIIEFAITGYKQEENWKKRISTPFSWDNEDYGSNTPMFIIKYSEFTELITKLGYSIDLKDFSDVKSKILSRKDADPRIIVDLTQEKKHTL